MGGPIPGRKIFFSGYFYKNKILLLKKNLYKRSRPIVPCLYAVGYWYLSSPFLGIATDRGKVLGEKKKNLNGIGRNRGNEIRINHS